MRVSTILSLMSSVRQMYNRRGRCCCRRWRGKCRPHDRRCCVSCKGRKIRLHFLQRSERLLFYACTNDIKRSLKRGIQAVSVHSYQQRNRYIHQRTQKPTLDNRIGNRIPKRLKTPREGSMVRYHTKTLEPRKRFSFRQFFTLVLQKREKNRRTPRPGRFEAQVRSYPREYVIQKGVQSNNGGS